MTSRLVVLSEAKASLHRITLEDCVQCPLIGRLDILPAIFAIDDATRNSHNNQQCFSLLWVAFVERMGLYVGDAVRSKTCQ